MSIFFDFDVGPSRRRFRRAIDEDKSDVELLIDREHTEKLFGEVDIGSLIELSTLSICMINENKEVIGFMSLCDHPNIPGVDASDWEMWIRNMYQKYFLSRNTLFIQFMCCKDQVLDVFLEEAISSVFRNDVYLTRIILLVNCGCESEHVMRYQPAKKLMHKCYPQTADDSEEIPHSMHIAMRQDYCPKLKIRRAVQEDNDDVVKILDKKCPRLKELYGKYYISELIGNYPESKRKIIVAEYQECAVGVMCLNSDVNYRSLQQKYELRPYHGLMKATPLEKELMRRNNELLTTFGEPIMLGEFTPFNTASGSAERESEDNRDSKEHLARKSNTSNKKQSKVYFKSKPDSSLRKHSKASSYRISDDYSERFFLRSPSLLSQQSIICNKEYVGTRTMLEEDPFDYEIVNIDKSLLSIAEAFTCELMLRSQESSVLSLPREPRLIKRKRKFPAPKVNRRISDSPKYSGQPNAFMIELFALHDEVDDRNSLDILEAAFEIMKNYDYCVISVPCAETTFSLLQHFTFVPTRPKISCEFSLYIAHRSSVLGKLRVREAELVDIPQIAIFLQNIEGKETLYTIEHSILERDTYRSFIFMSGVNIVGIGILESPEELNFVRAKYNIDLYYNHKYHSTGGGFCSVKAVLVYPVFEVHFRYFAREMLRLSGGNSLIWMTGYRNKLVAHKTNGLASAMVPLLPRKTDMDFSRIPELMKFSIMYKNITPFSTWFLDKKLSSVPTVNVTTRILVVGASRTAIAFLNSLLFGSSSSYLLFTNVTLISTHGLPYMRHSNAAVELMFPKYHNTTEKYLKSVPYTYYVNTDTGTMMAINKQEKYITLSSGAKYHYDLLFLMFGKQYQHPDYLKPLEKFSNMCTEKSAYVRLDIPNFNGEPDLIHYDTPENVFIINHVTEANLALKYVKDLLTDGHVDGFQVIVYGATIHAYCCLAALLELNIPPDSIVFVDPFPPEAPNKTRVSVFCNANVDETINEVLKNLKIRIYRSHYFQSWRTFKNIVTHVEFMSHFQVVNLECSAFFYYGTRGVNTQAFLAIHKSGMAYNAGILIDHQFRTKDPCIYAAGPVTSYCRYYPPAMKQKYYSSYEIGEKLGIQIRNQLDPLFLDKYQTKKMSVRFSDQEQILIEKSSFSSESNGDDTTDSARSSIVNTCEKAWPKLPKLTQPKVMHCRLPGGLQYLEVRSPGKKIPHYYLQSLHYNGIVLETFKTGYFKLHLTNDHVVDGITCLTFEKCSLEHLKNLYGKHSEVLNHVYLRYSAKDLDDLFKFFREPWAYFLYHDQTDELFAMVKELLPKGETSGETLKETLMKGRSLFHNTSSITRKMTMQKRLEATPYIDAITSYVIDWLSVHDVILPMYLQPTNTAEFVYDNEKNPMFKKKESLTNLIMKAF